MADDRRAEQSFKRCLPDIGRSLSDHRITALKWAIVSFGVVERSKLETGPNSSGLTLLQLFTELCHTREKAMSELYVMLGLCGCSIDSLSSIYEFVDGKVPLPLDACLVLFLGRTLERINEPTSGYSALCHKGTLFEQFVRHLNKLPTFSSYHKERMNTPEKLLNVICGESNQCNSQSICNWLCFHSSLTPYINELDKICEDNNHPKPNRQERLSLSTCISKWKWSILCVCVVLVVSLMVIGSGGVFGYYYDSSTPADDESQHVVFYSNTTRRIKCYQSKTKAVTMSTMGSSDDKSSINMYLFSPDEVGVVNAFLPRCTIISSRFPLSPGSTNNARQINYLQGDNPIFTANDGVIVFDIEIIDINPNSRCPMQILAFDNYQEYYRVLYVEGSSLTSSIPPVTPSCLNMASNFSFHYPLKANSYYFFVMVQGNSPIQLSIEAYANLTQYSIPADRESECSLSVNSHTTQSCTIQVAGFREALEPGTDNIEQCLIAEFISSMDFTSTLNVTVVSYNDTVYSFIGMMVAIGVLLLVIMVLIAVLIFTRCFSKAKCQQVVV